MTPRVGSLVWTSGAELERHGAVLTYPARGGHERNRPFVLLVVLPDLEIWAPTSSTREPRSVALPTERVRGDWRVYTSFKMSAIPGYVAKCRPGLVMSVAHVCATRPYLPPEHIPAALLREAIRRASAPATDGARAAG